MTAAEYAIRKKARELVAELRGRGATLHATSDGRLRYEIPERSGVTRAQMDTLKALYHVVVKIIATTCADCTLSLGVVHCELLDGRRICAGCMRSQ